MRTETRHSIVLTIGTGATAALGFIYVILAQRTLGAGASAEFIAALSFVAFCQIALGPINGTTARFTAQFAAKQEMGRVRSLGEGIARKVALFGLVGVAVGFVAVKPLTNAWHFQSLLSLLEAILIVYATLLVGVARGVFRGLQAFGRLNLNTIVEAAVRLGLGLAFLCAARNAQVALAAYLAALILILLVSKWQLRAVWADSSPVPIDGIGVRSFAGLMFLLMFTSAGFQNVDMFAVKHYFASSEAGVYGAAFTLGRMMGALATPFSTLLLPLAATLNEKGQSAAGSYLRVFSYFVLLAAVPLVLFGVWPDQVMALIYSREFAPAADILFIVSVARLLSYFCHMLVLIGAAAGAFGLLWVYLPGLFIQTVLLLIWHGSLKEVGVAMIIGQGLTLLVLVLFLWRRPGHSAAQATR